MSLASSIPRSIASGRTSSSASTSGSQQCTGSSERAWPPASMRVMSSTSLISSSRWWPARRMRSTRACASSSRPSSTSSWPKPRIALSGVRSSWLMRERNSLLASLARSASSPRLAGFGLGALTAGDVGRDAGERVGQPVGVEQRELDRQPAATLDAGCGFLDLEGPNRPHDLAVVGLVHGRGLEREHLAVGAADDVLAAQPEAALEVVIDERVATLGVLDVDERGRVVHD